MKRLQRLPTARLLANIQDTTYNLQDTTYKIEATETLLLYLISKKLSIVNNENQTNHFFSTKIFINETPRGPPNPSFTHFGRSHVHAHTLDGWHTHTLDKKCNEEGDSRSRSYSVG